MTAGIPGVAYPGPFPVGRYAQQLQRYLRERARVQITGEVFNLNRSRTTTYFELRDGNGALPCAMWNDDLDRLPGARGVLANGVTVVVAGGPDYYPGSGTSSPSFAFRVTLLKIAGEGDLLAQIERLRRVLAADGLLEPQSLLVRPLLPRTIGVVTGESGKARDDVLAGLHRRGWGGRLVWAFAPVQDRRAAPAVTRAVQDLAAVQVDVIIVARGGGSVADLLAFSDETLCRTVALLAVPVISSVGHHTDRPLIDDVAAVAASTPTHAAEVAVPLDLALARRGLHGAAGLLDDRGRRAVVTRARHLALLSQAPGRVLDRHRAALHQKLREIRASARRGGLERRGVELQRRALVLDRKASAARGADAAARRASLDAFAAALAAHDPARVVERGYAMVTGADGSVITSAAEARAAGRVQLGFHDGKVNTRIDDE